MTTDPSPTRAAIGRRIAAGRREAGLTQKDLADRLGTALAQVLRLERGEVDPAPLLPEVARAIGSSLAELAAPGQAATREAGLVEGLTDTVRLRSLEARLRQAREELGERDRTIAELRAALLDRERGSGRWRGRPRS